MDYFKELEALTALPGPSGYEAPVAAKVEELFSRFSGQVWRDAWNVYARMGEGGPRILLAAHMDEIAMMVRAIEDDGYLSLTRVGGVDPRCLPAHEVIVHGTEKLFGIIGAKPPHVTTDAERTKLLGWDDLYCDLGLAPEEVRAKVKVGDIVTYRSPLKRLQGDTWAGHALDDRACIIILAQVMEAIACMKLNCEVVFVGTVGEEVSSLGTSIANFDLRPDLCIAIDVTHGDTPDAPAFSSFPMDRPAISMGPTVHKGWTKMLMSAAKKLDMPYSVDVFEHSTYTDADGAQLVAEGIPVAVVSLPLRYMHTSVEVVRSSTMEKCARLLTRFIQDVSQEGKP